jgi:hypothetical protein
MTTLAAEFGASRLLQMRFGSVNLVWAVIIGLILIYFAAGYAIGGRQADKSPHPESMFTFLAWGGATLGLIPIIAQPILLAAASAMDALGLGAGRLPTHAAALPTDRHQPHNLALWPVDPAGCPRRPGNGKALG